MTNSAPRRWRLWPIFPTTCELAVSLSRKRGAALYGVTLTVECPRCGGSRTPSQTACTACGRVFTAYGHPGLTVFTAEPGQLLCTTCRYHAEGTCDLPNYPQATECTLYRDLNRMSPPPIRDQPYRLGGFLIGLLTLIAISILLAIYG